MATLERPRTTSATTTVPNFDATAVPQGFDASRWRNVDSDDLISLGEEQLFTGARSSGTRSAAAAVGASASTSQAEASTSTGVRIGEASPAVAPATPVMSEELFRSLVAAKQSFLLALNGLLQDVLDLDTPVKGMTPSYTPPLAGSSTNAHLSTNPLSRPAPSSLEVSAEEGEEGTAPVDLLSALLDNLRTHHNPPFTSSQNRPAMQSMGQSPLLGVPSSSTATGSETRVEELQSRLDLLAHDLRPVDAELARTLGALLACMERLLVISRSRSSAQSSPVTPSTPCADGRVDGSALTSTEGGNNLYLTLEREARALLAAKEEVDESVVGAAREVYLAEHDLLWGRVDDLSERVGLLCRQRAEEAAREEEEDVETLAGGEEQDVGEGSNGIKARRDSSLYEESQAAADLPRYSYDGPPAYFTDQTHPTNSFSDAKHDWEKPPLTPESGQASPDHSLLPPTARTAHINGQAPQTQTRGRRVSAAHSEKMQRDLDSVTHAIERLYVVSPQLANQRVEPDRRKLRERQLAKLGNAIERLSKGRFDDQRAAAAAMTLEEEEARGEEKAKRIKKVQEMALDKLIDQIDKAASRTLVDQRVDLKTLKRKERMVVDEVSADTRETQRRQYILEHTGKGRLASQDASFASGLVERFPRAPSPTHPVTITEFFRMDTDVDPARPRSDSIPAQPVVKKRFSGLFKDKSEDEGSLVNGNALASGSGSNKKSLRLGVFKKTSTPSMSRRGSCDSRIESAEGAGLGLTGSGMSRSGSVGLDADKSAFLVDYVAEESRNLGTIVVSFWPRVASFAKEEWEVISIDGDSILVAPSKGGPAARLALPSRVIPQHAAVVSQGTFNEVKLVTVPPSPTRSRPDLEVHAPLSTAELRESLPRTFACATCRGEIADTSSILKYNALPSEHWAELLDAWMCHQDQALSDDLVAKGKGIKPREGEGLVGSSYILFESGVTKNWKTPAGSEPERTEVDDVLYPIHCNSCDSLVGQRVASLAALDAPGYVRVLKYATIPSSPALSSPDARNPSDITKYSLASHLTSEMLEIGQAHACHRFLVQDAETETVKILLWFFNPAVRMSFSTTAPSASVLEERDLDKSSGLPGRNIGRTMNAVKVFYVVVESEDDATCRDFVSSGQSSLERISYPRAVVSTLTQLLQASTALYPPEKRSWEEMSIGFLERI